jgi:hypothetical protein
MKNQTQPQSPTEAAGYIGGVGLGATRSALRGKHISAAIIVLAAAVLIVGGSYLAHSDTKLFVQVVGCIVGAVGLAGWFISVTER